MTARAWAAALALAALGWLATVVGPGADTAINDLFVYRTYADALSGGAFPYRELALEYPPLALAPIWLASLPGGGESGYEVAFGALMLAATSGTLAATAALAGPRAALAAWLVALSPVLTGAVVRTHFDPLPVAVTVAALLALTRGRPRLGLALLGVGAMTKLFPALLVPVAAAWLLGRGERRAAAEGVAAFALVVLALSLPFAGGGYADAYRFHLERPVQIESTPASVLLALGGSHVTGAPVRPDRFKSNGLDGGAADAVAALFAGLLLAAVAAAALAASRRSGERALVLAAFAALLAFVALGKVLSPQFVAWLVPFAVLAWVWGERAPALLCAGAIALTQVEFPRRYFDLVAREPGAILLVAARNALLVAALTTLLARLAAPARSTRRASAPSPG